jgi:O-antigen/teichoic acid export membrane protein
MGSFIVYTFVLYLLTLKLGVDTFGIWIYLNSIINLGFLFINVGLDQIHYQYSGKEDFERYFSTFFFLKIILIIINVFTALIIITILQLWTNIFITLILFLLISKIFASTTQIFLVNLNTKLKIIISEFVSSSIIILKCIFILFLYFNFNSIINPIFYLCSAFLIIDLLSLLFILIISTKDIRFTKLNKELAYLYLKDQKYLFIGSIFMVAYTNFGNLMLYYSFGEESLGYMSLVVVYIIPSLLIFSNSFISIYQSYFPIDFENNNTSSIVEMTYKVEKYSSILYLSVIIIVFLSGQSMILVIFPKYDQSIVILNIMVFTPYLIGITQPYSYHIVSGKRLKTTVFINSITRFIAIFLMLILIPNSFLFFQAFELGLFGYALAHTLPWILWFFLCRYFSHRYFDIKPQRRTFIHIPLAIITFIAGLAIKNIFFMHTSNQIPSIILLTLISISIFFLLLFLAKELKKEDLMFFLQLLKIGNYKRAIKEELKK